ncbi:hypothetical protein PRIPAC_83163, partial [Pristionchus pacificus]|uniref:RNA-directed DNA polymerase n=1 Tax=Pristionchus pacificus TaxID=54126 RepID=A0A2A6BK71_PRIPA
MAAHPPTGCSRIQPPVYEKHGSSSFSEFRASLYDYWSFIGSTLLDAKRMLPTVLKGEARIIYQSIPDQMRTDNSSMDRLMETFEQRLFSDTEIDLLKDEKTRSLIRGRYPWSSCKAYLGNTDDIARTRDREAKEAFLSGLDDTITVDFWKLAPPNFQAAIKNAQQMENIIRKEKKEEKIDSLIQGVNSLFTNPAQQVPSYNPFVSQNNPFQTQYHPQNNPFLNRFSQQNPYSQQNPFQPYQSGIPPWRGYRGRGRGFFRGRGRGFPGGRGSYQGYRGPYQGYRGRGNYNYNSNREQNQQNQQNNSGNGNQSGGGGGGLSKYQIALLEHNQKIVYRRGRLNVVADALSRFTPDEVKEPLPEKKPTTTVNTIDLTTFNFRKMQSDSPWIQEIIRVMEEGIDSPLSRKYGRKYSLQDGMLYLKERGRWTNPLKVILPEKDPQLEEIVRSFHTSPHIASYAGVEKTLQLLADRAYWKGMREMVNNVCRSCPQCAKCKTNPHDNTVELMKPIINTTKNCTTNMSPFFALYGRNAVVPEDVLFETTGRKPEEDRTEIWKDVKQAIETSNTKSIAKFRRNRRVRNRQVKEGALVLVNRAPPAHKLAPQRPIS